MSLPRPSHGRVVTLLVLGALILTVSAAVYIFVAQQSHQPVPVGGISSDEESARLAADAQRLVTLLTILLMSALLILLFVLGSYLVIRVGQFVARERVGGKPTRYVDAWQSYRLTDEQISAATADDRTDDNVDDRPADPNGPPSGPDPDTPHSGS